MFCLATVERVLGVRDKWSYLLKGLLGFYIDTAVNDAVRVIYPFLISRSSTSMHTKSPKLMIILWLDGGTYLATPSLYQDVWLALFRRLLLQEMDLLGNQPNYRQNPGVLFYAN